MTLTVTTIVVLFACPLAWSLLDLLRKQLASGGRAIPLTFMVVMANLPWLLLWAWYDNEWTIGSGYWLPGLGSMIVNLLANLAYMQSVRLSPMSATVPLLSLTPAFSTLWAVPLLGEVPRLVPGLGVVVVVLGALALNAPANAATSPMAWWRGLRGEPGSRYMVAVALFWSITPVLDKRAVAHAGTGVHALFLSAGIAIGLLVVLLAQRRLGEVRVPKGLALPLAIAGLVGVVALALQLWAIQLVWVGLMETAKRGVGAVLALAFGRFLFSETIEGRKIIAVVVMTLGVWMVIS